MMDRKPVKHFKPAQLAFKARAALGQVHTVPAQHTTIKAGDTLCCTMVPFNVKSLRLLVFSTNAYLKLSYSVDNSVPVPIDGTATTGKSRFDWRCDIPEGSKLSINVDSGEGEDVWVTFKMWEGTTDGI